MAYSLKLNSDWDIGVDGNGNIQTCLGDYAIAQNCANAVRLFTNDAYFWRQRGIPHYDIELGRKERAARAPLVNRLRKAVLAVDGVNDAMVELAYDAAARRMGGEITIRTDTGSRISIEL